MKLTQILMVAISILILAACSEKTYEPRAVNPETDVCQICNMSITHMDYAAQTVYICTQPLRQSF